jgi:hypothetical protein
MESEANTERKLVGAGGTPGGIGIFLLGFVMACVGGWLLTNQVTVSGNFFASSFALPVVGYHMHSFGLSLIPFIAGVGFLFFNGKSIVGWLLTLGGLGIIVAGILMSLHIYFQPTSLFNTLIMLVLLFGAYALGGANGCIVLTILLLLATVGILYASARRFAPDALVVALIALALVIASPRYVPRPEMLSFVLLATYLWLLDGYPENGSAIYDSCALAHEKLGQRDTLYSTIILISDGRDTASRLIYSDLRESFKRANVPVYSICLEDPGGSGADRGDLKKLSAVSGGAAYIARYAAELRKGLERTATELRHQYVIGYYPDDVQRNGSWHPVEVMAFAPGQDSQDTGPLVVRSMSGYNAPDKPSSTQQEVPRLLK